MPNATHDCENSCDTEHCSTPNENRNPKTPIQSHNPGGLALGMRKNFGLHSIWIDWKRTIFPTEYWSGSKTKHATEEREETAPIQTQQGKWLSAPITNKKTISNPNTGAPAESQGCTAVPNVKHVNTPDLKHIGPQEDPLNC